MYTISNVESEICLTYQSAWSGNRTPTGGLTSGRANYYAPRLSSLSNYNRANDVAVCLAVCVAIDS